MAAGGPGGAPTGGTAAPAPPPGGAPDVGVFGPSAMPDQSITTGVQGPMGGGEPDADMVLRQLVQAFPSPWLLRLLRQNG